MPNELATQIMDLLSPSVGGYVARLQITAACFMAGLNIDRLTENEIKPLSDRIELIYESKFGKEVARRIKNKILSISHETPSKIQNAHNSINS